MEQNRLLYSLVYCLLLAHIYLKINKYLLFINLFISD